MTAKKKHGSNCQCKFECKPKYLLDSGYERDLSTYTRTNLRSRRNDICPITAWRRHKSPIKELITNTQPL